MRPKLDGRKCNLLNMVLDMNLAEWKYLISEGVGAQFVQVQKSGRNKFTENPACPEKELEEYLDVHADTELLLMPPCSKKTLDVAMSLVSELIVIDYDSTRLQLFQDLNPELRVKLVEDLAGLRTILSSHKDLLERAKVRAYVPSRYARLDRKINNLLTIDLLQLQKEYASSAANRSLKRWHTNTNLLMNLRSLDKYISNFPKLSVPFVIVGAGPSLDYTVETLKLYQGRACIVATDGALQSLYANGVKPDFIVSAEDTLMSWRFVAGLGDFIKDIPLILSSKANHLLFREYRGSVVLTRESSVEEWADPFMEGLPTLECGRCVGHMAYNWAVACQASHIIMTGFDLAYRGDVFHPQDMPVPYFHGMVEPEIEYVKDWRGGLLKTDLSMLTFLRDFEWMIQHTAISVYDATEGGAKKVGAIEVTLGAVLSELPKLEVTDPLQFLEYDKAALQDYISLFGKNSSRDKSFIMPFTSYLLQKSLAIIDKEKDFDDSKKYLEALFLCPIHKGVNQAVFIDDGVDQRILDWAEEEHVCTYKPKDLLHAIHLCKELSLGRIYCCDGVIDPDLLMLTDIEIVDIKLTNERTPYDRCLWTPNYSVMVGSEWEAYWRDILPGDIKIQKSCIQLQEISYGMH
jgi:hypothetical protein